MKNICFIVLISMLTVQSPLFSQSKREEKLKSENQLMTKKLSLIERRSKILEDENAIVRKNLLDSENTVKQQNHRINDLENKIRANTEEYTKNMNEQKSRYEALSEKTSAEQKRLNEKIADLEARNKNTELVLGNEIKKIKDELKLTALTFEKQIETMKKDNLARDAEFLKKSDDFNRQIENLKKESVLKNADFEKKSENFKKQITERDEVLKTYDKLNKDYDADLKKMKAEDEVQIKQISELEGNIKKMKDESDKKAKSFSELEDKYKSVSADIEAKNAAIKKLEIRIEDLTGKNVQK